MESQDWKNPALLERYLRTTHPEWTCTNLTKLSGGYTNLTCRATLSKDDSSVILKRAKDWSGMGLSLSATRAADEYTLLEALKDDVAVGECAAGGPVKVHVRTPRPVVYLEDSHTQIMEDMGAVEDLKSFMMETDLDGMGQVARRIGDGLGVWLKRFHLWGRAPEQSALRAKLRKTDNVRLKHVINFGQLESAIAAFPSELSSLKDIAEELSKEPATFDEEEIGIIHGDFGTGNVLIPDLTQRLDRTAPLLLSVIDWELTQVSNSAYDIGQVCAELYLLYHFKHRRSALELINGFLAAYGLLPEKSKLRAVMHFGTHLAVWPARVPGWGTDEQIRECVKVGGEAISAAARKDFEVLARGPLGALFKS